MLAFCQASCLRRRGVAGPAGGLLCLLLAGPVVSTLVSVAGPARGMSAKATEACIQVTLDLGCIPPDRLSPLQ